MIMTTSKRAREAFNYLSNTEFCSKYRGFQPQYAKSI